MGSCWLKVPSILSAHSKMNLAHQKRKLGVMSMVIMHGSFVSLFAPVLPKRIWNTYDYAISYYKNLGRLWLAYTELQGDFTCYNSCLLTLGTFIHPVMMWACSNASIYLRKDHGQMLIESAQYSLRKEGCSQPRGVTPPVNWQGATTWKKIYC